MKTKKIGSKLVLTKRTIANLNAREMTIVKAGILGDSDAISCTGICISTVVSGCCPTHTCPATEGC